MNSARVKLFCGYPWEKPINAVINVKRAKRFVLELKKAIF